MESIPCDILYEISLRADISDIASMSATCKQLWALANIFARKLDRITCNISAATPLAYQLMSRAQPAHIIFHTSGTTAICEDVASSDAICEGVASSDAICEDVASSDAICEDKYIHFSPPKDVLRNVKRLEIRGNCSLYCDTKDIPNCSRLKVYTMNNIMLHGTATNITRLYCEKMDNCRYWTDDRIIYHKNITQLILKNCTSNGNSRSLMDWTHYTRRKDQPYILYLTIIGDPAMNVEWNNNWNQLEIILVRCKPHTGYQRHKFLRRLVLFDTHFILDVPDALPALEELVLIGDSLVGGNCIVPANVRIITELTADPALVRKLHRLAKGIPMWMEE